MTNIDKQIGYIYIYIPKLTNKYLAKSDKTKRTRGRKDPLPGGGGSCPETGLQTGFETGLQTGFGIKRFGTEAGFLMIPVSVLRFPVSVSVSGLDVSVYVGATAGDGREKA